MQKSKAGKGIPRLETFLKIAGACPSTARAKRVLDPMYRSELAAEKTKSCGKKEEDEESISSSETRIDIDVFRPHELTRIAALMMEGRVLILAI